MKRLAYCRTNRKRHMAYPPPRHLAYPHEDHHCAREELIVNLACRVDAIHLRHHQVHQDHVGVQRLDPTIVATNSAWSLESDKIRKIQLQHIVVKGIPPLVDVLHSTRR